MVNLKVLDLFSGLEGWSSPFKERGHEVFTVDNSDMFNADLKKNIFDLTVADIPWQPDLILASPPCEKFSVMNIGRNWYKDHTPKTEGAALAVNLVKKTFDLIQEMEPKYWVVENPRAKLRKLDVVQPYERRTVTYCQYGKKFMKPTDLWGGFPPSLELRPMCQNGAPCHVRAVRGSKTGVQSKTQAAEVAKIPEELSLQICLAVEKDLGVVSDTR